jgi:hypothetical protein
MGDNPDTFLVFMVIFVSAGFLLGLSRPERRVIERKVREEEVECCLLKHDGKRSKGDPR